MGSSKAWHWFPPIAELLDQEVSSGHYPASSIGKPEEEAESQATLQKEGLLSKVFDERDEVQSSARMQVPPGLFAGAGSV